MRCDWEVIRTDGFGHKTCHRPATVRLSLQAMAWVRCDEHAETLRREYRSFPSLVEEPIGAGA
jgi:hypothetical protein